MTILEIKKSLDRLAAFIESTGEDPLVFDKDCKHELIAEIPHVSGDIEMVILFEDSLDAKIARLELSKMGIEVLRQGNELTLFPLAYKKLFGDYYEYKKGNK